MANRAFSIMRRVYTWALGRDLVASTPFIGIHKPAVETARDRVLTPDEIVKVFSALRHERPIIAGLWELLFHTGVRPGTVLRACWTDIKMDRAVWEVPITKRARGAVTPIYSRYAFLDEKRKALGSWGSHLEALIRPKPAAKLATQHSRPRLAAVSGRRQRAGA